MGQITIFLCEKKFVRLIPFKDHINVEASAVITYKDALMDYTITPKGMLQIYHHQPVPNDVLEKIVKDSFEL